MKKQQIANENLEDAFDIDYIHRTRKRVKVRIECDMNIQIEEYIKYRFFEGIKNDLENYNYQTLLNKYVEYFETKELKYEIIKKGAKFYRGRIGKIEFKGNDKDLDTDFTVPFHLSQIGAPPHLYTKGGRFNREGISYLYLASDIKTCLAEIHLQVGQECSIAEFECQEETTLLNLVDGSTDLEMRAWYEILTQPVYDGAKHNYLITQFLSDVLSKFSSNGIFFYSSQINNRKKGENRCIVSFKPEQFKLIPFSERIYKASSVTIRASCIEDSADIYSKNSEDINTFNEHEENSKEEEFKYLSNLIKFRKKNPLIND